MSEKDYDQKLPTVTICVMYVPPGCPTSSEATSLQHDTEERVDSRGSTKAGLGPRGPLSPTSVSFGTQIIQGNEIEGLKNQI